MVCYLPGAAACGGCPWAVLSPHWCSREGLPRSDEAWSLPRPHVSGKPLQSPASQAQVWGPRSGHQAYTDGPVRDLGVHTLAPQETLLIIGGIGGSGKSQEATYVASRKVGSSPTARPAESCSDSFWGL